MKNLTWIVLALLFVATACETEEGEEGANYTTINKQGGFVKLVRNGLDTVKINIDNGGEYFASVAYTGKNSQVETSLLLGGQEFKITFVVKESDNPWAELQQNLTAKSYGYAIGEWQRLGTPANSLALEYNAGDFTPWTTASLDPTFQDSSYFDVLSVRTATPQEVGDLSGAIFIKAKFGCKVQCVNTVGGTKCFVIREDTLVDGEMELYVIVP